MSCIAYISTLRSIMISVQVDYCELSFQMKNAVSLLAGDLSQALKSVGALESTLSCYSFHDDMIKVHNGLCFDGM